MVMVLNRRIRRVILANKVQYIGSIFLIVFSTLMFTLMTNFAMNFERMTREFESDYVQEDATFTVDGEISDVQALEAAGNAMIEAGKTFDYAFPDGKKLRIFSQNDRINLSGIMEGTGLNASGDILVGPGFAAAGDYDIGDQVSIMDRAFTIVGFVALPNYIYPVQTESDFMPQPGFGIAVISDEDFAALGEGNTFYAVKFNAVSEDPVTRSAQFRGILGNQGISITRWTDIADNRRVNIVDVEIGILNIVSRAVPTAILLLVSIMVSNVIGRMMNQESGIIGALYALGYRRAEIYRHYLIFPLLIAIVGGIIGTIIGIFPVSLYVSFFISVFNVPKSGIQIQPITVLVSMILPILFLGITGYFVTYQELSHSPVDLMRGKEERYKANPLERLLRLERFSFSTKFRIREQLRSLSRLAFLLFGVIVATMLLLWGFTLKSGFDYLLSSGLSSVYNFQYEYIFHSLRTEPLSGDAEPVSAATFLPVGGDSRDFYVTGVMPDSAMVQLNDESGRLLNTDQIIVTKPLANQLNVKQGESVNIIRKVDGRTFTLVIDSIADSYAGKFIFMPLPQYYETFEEPAGSYTGAFSNELLDIPDDQSYTVMTLDDKIAGVREAIAPTQMMMGFLTVMAFIIGMIVIYVVTSLIVEENKHTISLMKIFGYQEKEINSLILNSSTIVVVIGFILGIPLTVSALDVLVQLYEESIGLALPPSRVDLPYLLAGFIVVMLSHELSKRMCRRKIAAIPMSEALKLGME